MKFQGILKTIATEFFYSWHNQPGSNTRDAFDEWWSENGQRFEIAAQEVLGELISTKLDIQDGDVVRIDPEYEEFAKRIYVAFHSAGMHVMIMLATADDMDVLREEEMNRLGWYRREGGMVQ